jgi:hypothetical protein
MAATASGVQQLKGKWLWTDGGYVVDVRAVEDGGHMDVAYFNPQPIKVCKAVASREGVTMKVFLELRDVHYPGSTYTLTYRPGERSAQGRLLPGCPPAALCRGLRVDAMNTKVYGLGDM